MVQASPHLQCQQPRVHQLHPSQHHEHSQAGVSQDLPQLAATKPKLVYASGDSAHSYNTDGSDHTLDLGRKGSPQVPTPPSQVATNQTPSGQDTWDEHTEQHG